MRFNYRIFKSVSEFRPLTYDLENTSHLRPKVVFWDKFRTKSDGFLSAFQAFNMENAKREAMHAI
jgi:hypothetical protein